MHHVSAGLSRQACLLQALRWEPINFVQRLTSYNALSCRPLRLHRKKNAKKSRRSWITMDFEHRRTAEFTKSQLFKRNSKRLIIPRGYTRIFKMVAG